METKNYFSDFMPACAPAADGRPRRKRVTSESEAEQQRARWRILRKITDRYDFLHHLRADEIIFFAEVVWRRTKNQTVKEAMVDMQINPRRIWGGLQILDRYLSSPVNTVPYLDMLCEFARKYGGTYRFKLETMLEPLGLASKVDGILESPGPVRLIVISGADAEVI